MKAFSVSLVIALLMGLISNKQTSHLNDMPGLNPEKRISAPRTESTKWNESQGLTEIFAGRNTKTMFSRSHDGIISGNLPASDQPYGRSGFDLRQAGLTTDLAGAGIIGFVIPEKEYADQERMLAMDAHANSAPLRTKTSMEDQVDFLVKPARNEMEKARVLFSWVAHNIVYDDKGFNTGKFSDNSARGTYENGKAVCQGYSELLGAMATEAGLEARLVIGYSKGIAYMPGMHFQAPDHAWNAIRINGEWELFDATWAAGYGTVVKGKLKSVSRYNDYWFCTMPEEFIFSHFPEEQKWQLTEQKISLDRYELLPGVDASFFELGFNGMSCLEEALAGTLESFPTTYMSEGGVQAISLPVNQVIQSGRRIMLVLESSSASSIAIVNNGKWYMLEKDGNEFGAVIDPEPGELTVNANFDPNSYSYSTLLAYRVD